MQLVLRSGSGGFNPERRITMRRTIVVFGIALIALNCVGLFFLRAPFTQAKSMGYTEADVWGSYASQLTGSINVPAGHPYYAFNGAYALTGRVFADGQGNARGTVYDNYNGFLLNYSWEGVYTVSKEGFLTLTTALDLSAVGMGKLPLQMSGVLCDEGKQIRLMMTGPGMKVQGIPWVGATIIGSWMRQ
jgi:hypothetical protein